MSWFWLCITLARDLCACTIGYLEGCVTRAAPTILRCCNFHRQGSQNLDIYYTISKKVETQPIAAGDLNIRDTVVSTGRAFNEETANANHRKVRESLGLGSSTFIIYQCN